MHHINDDIRDDTLDEILTLQLGVAWAGERGVPGEPETRRMGWWATCAVDEFGGEELYTRLVPQTSAWATFETARRAAWWVEEARLREANGQLLSLFHLSPELNELLEDRLYAHKLSGRPIEARLPALGALISQCAPDEAFDEGAFRSWAAALGAVAFEDGATGRRLQSAPREALEIARQCAAALAAPTSHADTWPMPHVSL